MRPEPSAVLSIFREGVRIPYYISGRFCLAEPKLNPTTEPQTPQNTPKHSKHSKHPKQPKHPQTGPTRPGRRGSHTMTQGVRMCILEAPTPETPPKFHEKTPRENIKSEISGGTGKKRKFRHPPFVTPPFNPLSTVWDPPLFRSLGPLPSGPHHPFVSFCRCFCCCCAAAVGVADR